jgi:hypothetical protein
MKAYLISIYPNDDGQFKVEFLVGIEDAKQLHIGEVELEMKQ